MRSATLLSVLLLLGGCGGPQPASEPVPPSPAVAPAPPPAPEPPPGPDLSGLLWYVYWEGIHCLTVYPMPGLVRSEEPHNATATFQSRNPYFSIISVYYEREAAWAPAVDAATSLDDLLARLAAMDQVIVEEAENPVQQSQF